MKKQGYKLIKANFMTPFGEADAVMSKGGVTYFIEVKTRSGLSYGEPKDSVGYKKQEKYRKIAEYYMLKYGETEIDFVVAEVMGKDINLIFNAF